MKRRRLIALISVCILLFLGLGVVVGGLVIMHTDIARRFVESRLASAITGSVHIGRISGNPFTGLTIDSIEIKDKSGEVFLRTGRVAVDYDIRDIMDTRLYLRHVIADHPFIHLRRHANNRWNYQEIFAGKSSPAPMKAATGRSWGDFIVVDSVRALNGTFLLSLPWALDDTLRGAVRDSVIRHELARTDRSNAKTFDGYARTFTWSNANAMLSHVRLADPDSDRFGQTFQIASLDVDESDPPFRFRRVAGNVKRLADTATISFTHWDLPGSTGSASGTIAWGDSGTRYNLVVRGDSVSLRDINWTYTTLPKTGGGRMLVRISNKRENGVMDYHIDSMDVHSTGSHLAGEMTFGVGGPVLELRNVNMTLDPLDFELIKALNGKPFPIDWKGQIFGDVRAPGGPVTDFRVDAASGEWRDAHIPGAVTRLSGRGGLNILQPAYTEFHEFAVDVQTLDLRSIEYLFPALPKLKGTLAGKATLDSSWLDVRFHDADITHRDGAGVPSRFTGSGRITDGSPFVTYALDLIANPISFETLARSFPAIKLRGVMSGPIQIRGRSPELTINTTLAGAGGAIHYDGTIDIDSAGGYAVRGRGDVARVNLAELLMEPDARVTSLSGNYDVDLHGSSLRNLTGVARAKLDSSRYDTLNLMSPASATVHFENGHAVTNDTIHIRSPLGDFFAIGALGLVGDSTRASTDSIHVGFSVDPKGSLRAYFAGFPAGVDSAGGLDSTAALASAGKLVIEAVAVGSIENLSIAGTARGQNLTLHGVTARSFSGAFSLNDILRSPNGTLWDTLATVKAAGLQFDEVSNSIHLLDSSRATFTVNSGRIGTDSLPLQGDSVGVASAGEWNSLGGRNAVRFDSLAFAIGLDRWLLHGASTLTFDSTGFAIDTVDLRNTRGGTIGFAGKAPLTTPVDLRVAATRVPISTIDRIFGVVSAPLTGLMDFSAQVAGTQDHPTINAVTTLDSISISDVRIGRLLANARYANQRAGVDVSIFKDAKEVLRGTADSLPLAISFSHIDTLPGRVRATATVDSADFTLIQAFVKNVSRVTGKLSGSLSLDGSWDQPNLTATSMLTDGALTIDTLGISLAGITGAVSYAKDTLRIVDSIRAESGGSRNIAVASGKIGFAKGYPSWFDLSFNLRDFEVYNRLELATIFATSDLVKLKGPIGADSLTGVINVNNGAIYYPDPKQIGKTFSQEETGVVAANQRVASKSLYDSVTAHLRTDLTVHVAGAFKLSGEGVADIPLAGDLQIVPVTTTSATTNDFVSRLAPSGTINADRGTFTLSVQGLPGFRRDLSVERGGTITFDRDASWNGILNISARYTVRPRGRPEVPVIVDVTGPLLHPTVALRSDAPYAISESDLLSYLLIGEPGFDLFGTSNVTGDKQTMVSALLSPLASSYATAALRDFGVSKWVDQFRVEASDVSSFSNLLNTRVAGDKAILGNKVFLSVSTSLCGFSSAYKQQQTTKQALTDQLGVTVEWRLTSNLQGGSSAQFGSEPSTQALLCSSGDTGLRGVAPTPRQFSLSWLRFWRW